MPDRKLPPIQKRKIRIAIIGEGLEEKKYLDRLINLQVWDDVYEVTCFNAKSASKICARYQDIYNSDRFELVLIFCDTDKFPHREYMQIKKQINDFFDRPDAADKVIIYANPCTMQIILLHFAPPEAVSMRNQGKKTNSDLICEYTDIKDYDAHEDQIDALCRKIKRKNYEDMYDRVMSINKNDTTSSSSNFGIFLRHFPSNDTAWIEEIREYLESNN